MILAVCTVVHLMKLTCKTLEVWTSTSKNPMTTFGRKCIRIRKLRFDDSIGAKPCQNDGKHVKHCDSTNLSFLFFDLYVYLCVYTLLLLPFYYLFYLRLPFSRGHASINQCIKWQVCAMDCLSARCERIFRAPWKQEMNQWIDVQTSPTLTSIKHYKSTTTHNLP